MMRVRTAGTALAAGIAVFLLAGVAVTELVGRWIEFSVFVGIPAGFVLGTTVAVIVYVSASDTAPVRRRQVATATGVGGATLVLSLVGTIGVFHIPVVTSLVLAFALGVLTAIGVRLSDTLR